jgi:hypothetical protein
LQARWGLDAGAVAGHDAHNDEASFLRKFRTKNRYTLFLELLHGRRPMIKAIPFDFPYDGRLEPRHTALLVIDLQEDFLSPTGYFARIGYDPSPLRAILPAVNRLIAAARAAGLTIIHTRQGYRADMADMTPYEKWRRKRAGLDGTDVLLRSGPGFQICADVNVGPRTSSSTRPATVPSPIRTWNSCCARGT